MYPLQFSLKAQNYKSIGEERQGFEAIYPVNIIVGRNNAGKSSLLDILEPATKDDTLWLNHKHNEKSPGLFFTVPLSEAQLSKIFSNNIRGGQGFTRDKTHFEQSKQWINKTITIDYTDSKNPRVSEHPFPKEVLYSPEYSRLAHNILNPLKGKVFKRLLADRDVVPENDSQDFKLDWKGSGCTQAIHYFINHSDSTLYKGEQLLLNALNEIFAPDSTFLQIRVRQNATDLWEVQLEEKHKSRPVPLSNSGSGFKTILLVLVNLLLVPVKERQPLSNYVFAFEELENNLHPALQRRLMSFILKKAKESKCCFFITTHSNVIIDFFSKNEDAQIIHVTHDGKRTTASQVNTYIHNKNILDDLDVRASDLLQSNCIVWVEGPSDRLYFNRWMELISKGKIVEGAHYQCVFYGGRLLAHLNADSGSGSGIPMLKVNRNSIVIIDSDRRKKDTPLNDTKRRIIREIESNGGIAWVTGGREIENYIPASALGECLAVSHPSKITRYGDFSQYLNRLKNGEGKKYLDSKVLFAEKVIPYIKESDLNCFDFKYSFEMVYNKIADWNKIDGER